MYPDERRTRALAAGAPLPSSKRCNKDEPSWRSSSQGRVSTGRIQPRGTRASELSCTVKILKYPFKIKLIFKKEPVVPLKHRNKTLTIIILSFLFHNYCSIIN